MEKRLSESFARNVAEAFRNLRAMREEAKQNFLRVEQTRAVLRALDTPPPREGAPLGPIDNQIPADPT